MMLLLVLILCAAHDQNTECIGKFLETADVIARRPRAAAEGEAGGDAQEEEEEGAPRVTPMMFITSEK